MRRFGRPVSVAGLYYTHGLFCASYPGTVIAFVALAVITCSLPFFITSTGDLNTPKPWRSPWLNYRVPTRNDNIGTAQWIINNATQLSERTPSWFLGLPVAVIQQLYVDVEIACPSRPTRQALCQKSYYSISRKTAAHILEQMKETVGKCTTVLHPAAIKFAQSLNVSEDNSAHASSGILSPALDSIRSNWEDEEQFGYHSIKELLYGGFWEREHRQSSRDNGRPTKTHTFGITFLLEADRERFSALTSCVQNIKTHWPDPGFQATFIKHFYYEPEWYLMDFAPLLGVYFIVFLYISFSVGKIDLVKSKYGLGFTAFITVVASLTMSLGICTFFGMSISLSGSEIYPFMVVIFGLENILIIVKAVMSTPVEFDVKNRIATGLSIQGGHITRNVITLVVMLAVGIAIFNYTMKEFCIIALVGLLCDGFLQLTFFPTVLSIDLRRLELSDLSSATVAIQQAADEGELDPPPRPCPTSLQTITPLQWNSKRVKFAYFLANARIVSRACMVVLFAYLLAWFLRTEFFLNMVGMKSVNNTPVPPLPGAHSDLTFDKEPTVHDIRNNLKPKSQPDVLDSLTNGDQQTSDGVRAGSLWQDLSDISGGQIEMIPSAGVDGFGVMCEEDMCWRAMVTIHWPKLLQNHGYEMESRFLTLLPPISVTVRLGLGNHDHPSPSPPTLIQSLLHTLTHTLSHPNIIRVIFVVAAMVSIVMYFAALVRSSQLRHKRHQESVMRKHYNAKIGHLRGHQQDIECLCVDGMLVVSAGLEGSIRIWDSSPMKRRCVMEIERGTICGEPSEVSSSSNRHEADGCEADNDSQGVSSTPLQGSQKLLRSFDASAALFAAPVSHQQLLTDAGNVPSQTSFPPMDIKTTPVQTSLSHPSTSFSPLPPCTPPPSPRTTTSHLYRRISDSSVVHILSSSGAPSYPSPPQQLAAMSTHAPSYPSPPQQLAAMSTHAPSYPSPPHQPAAMSTHAPSYPGIPSYPQSCPPSVQENPASHHRRGPSGSSLQGVPAVPLSPVPGTTTFHMYTPTFTTHTPHHPTFPPMSPSLPTPTHSKPPTGTRPWVRSHCRSQSATTLPHIRIDLSQTNFNINTLRASNTYTTQTHSRCLSSTTQKDLFLPNRYHRPGGHSRSSSLGNVTQRPTHSRNRSLGSIPWSSSHSFSRPLVARNDSLGNLSNVSTETAFSTTSGRLFDNQPSQKPNPQEGYDFSRHFNLFSQFTSNMALQYCTRTSEDVPECKAPPVWCMDVGNKVIAVGCGNGQVEAWDAASGSLMFCRSVAASGVTTISVHSTGVISGHMDGSLHLIGYNGIPAHSIRAHRKPISVMRCTADRVVTGGYDTVVKVHRIPDFHFVNSVFIHNGSLTALTLVEVNGCVSGCSNGLVCYWELNSGSCLHEFEEYGSPVLKLDGARGLIVALFAEECVRIWESTTGMLLSTIQLDGPCHSFTMLGDKHIVTSLESHVVVYNIETGEKHSKKAVERLERGVALIRHIVALDGVHIVCSIGKDIQIIPCNLKLKID